jgi:hypothetical protein
MAAKFENDITGRIVQKIGFLIFQYSLTDGVTSFTYKSMVFELELK